MCTCERDVYCACLSGTCRCMPGDCDCSNRTVPKPMENHMGNSTHARLLAGEQVPIDPNSPIPGWYRTKSRRPGGKTDVFVPVRYQYSGDFDDLECFIDGKRVEHQRA